MKVILRLRALVDHCDCVLMTSKSSGQLDGSLEILIDDTIIEGTSGLGAPGQRADHQGDDHHGPSEAIASAMHLFTFQPRKQTRKSSLVILLSVVETRKVIFSIFVSCGGQKFSCRVAVRGLDREVRLGSEGQITI
jgi:hypothetical protein